MEHDAMTIWTTIAVCFSFFAMVFAAIALGLAIYSVHLLNPNRGRVSGGV